MHFYNFFNNGTFLLYSEISLTKMDESVEKCRRKNDIRANVGEPTPRASLSRLNLISWAQKSKNKPPKKLKILKKVGSSSWPQKREQDGIAWPRWKRNRPSVKTFMRFFVSVTFWCGKFETSVFWRLTVNRRSTSLTTTTTTMTTTTKATSRRFNVDVLPDSVWSYHNFLSLLQNFKALKTSTLHILDLTMSSAKLWWEESICSRLLFNRAFGWKIAKILQWDRVQISDVVLK